MVEAGDEVRGRLWAVGDTLAQRIRERPYDMLGLAMVVGYIAGGGLFSSLTRPLARAALGALLVPGFRDRLRGLAEELREAQATGAA
ncbi:MAG TPA: hypothetical protein VF904_13980 [Anaeromyxobacteraceae bacterium]